MMKGIVLAGGTGSRLHPITLGTSKQLMAVYDKPMIYYPISTLILAGIQDILLITTPGDKDKFHQLLGDGSQFGINITYTEQPSPDGLAQAFILGEKHIGNEKVSLILGDNLFYGPSMGTHLRSHNKVAGGTIFGYWVNNPEAYGVVEFNNAGKAISLEEKPMNPKSNWAVPGLYFYDNNVVEIAKSLKPSPRGELEITDINKIYMNRTALNVQILPRGTAWLDTGTFNDLNDASNYIRTIESRQGLKVGCPEEVAWRVGLLTDSELEQRAQRLLKSGYGRYLLSLLEQGK